MKRISSVILMILLIGAISKGNAQYDKIFHEAKFDKYNGIMHSKHYKTDDWEKSLYDKSEKIIFPSDINKNPEAFKGKLIHWIGIVKNVSVSVKNDTSVITILLDNKYWDYIEDYSIQDEVMFISPKGDGQFKVMVNSIKLTDREIESIKKFSNENKLLLCYGLMISCENGVPILDAKGLKIVDYKLYSTKIFSYEIERDKNDMVVFDKSGNPVLINFQRLKIAGPGQNK